MYISQMLIRILIKYHDSIDDSFVSYSLLSYLRHLFYATNRQRAVSGFEWFVDIHLNLNSLINNYNLGQTFLTAES